MNQEIKQGMLVKGIKVSTLFFLVFACNLFSQQLSHQVLVPVAGVTAAGGFDYSQTIGEEMIEVISNPDYVLTQGFQQPGMRVTSELKPDGNGVDVYPNPAKDYIYIKFFGDKARGFRVEIINMAGSIVHTGTISFTDSYFYIQQVEFDEYKVGLYFVRIKSDDGLIERTFKIEKI
ncbi:MAG TPA: T9SS type A sorting domain-containing protein [Bacteroidales bacterium]|nr:T9SS type A sorting domain-containing protein [Bacteroidales bacterium]